RFGSDSASRHTNPSSRTRTVWVCPRHCRTKVAPDNAPVAHRLLEGIGHPLHRQNVREWQNDDLALKSHFDWHGHVRLPLVRAARPTAAAKYASLRRAAT